MANETNMQEKCGEILKFIKENDLDIAEVHDFLYEEFIKNEKAKEKSKEDTLKEKGKEIVGKYFVKYFKDGESYIKVLAAFGVKVFVLEFFESKFEVFAEDYVFETTAKETEEIITTYQEITEKTFREHAHNYLDDFIEAKSYHVEEDDRTDMSV